MSDATNLTSELMAGFLDEAPEYLEILDTGLLAFESKAGDTAIALDDPDDQARMNEMFRAAHSLKGLGAAMGFDKIRDLTHVMETLFDHIRMGKRSLDPDSIETLFGVFDTLRALIGELADPGDDPVTIENALQTLNDIMNEPPTAESPATDSPQPDAEDTPTAAAASSPAPPAASDAVGQTLSALDPDLLRMFVDTTLETIDGLSEGLLKLEGDADNIELINEVFRCAHNIKGATGVVGCDGLQRLTHDMETVLDRLRSQAMQLDDQLIAALLGVVDRVRTDVELIKAGRFDEMTVEGTDDAFSKWLDSGGSEMVDSTATASAGAGASSGPVMDHDDLAVVTVTFPPDFVESEIQAFLINNKLGEVGDVVATSPDLDRLDGTNTLEHLEFRVRTTSSTDELEALVSLYTVQSVKAVRQGPSNSPSTPATSPTEAQSARRDEPQSTPASNPSQPPEKKPAPAATGQDEAGNKPAARKQAAPPAAAKVGETLRVDLERLDQLMNLGGELVINKARFGQIHSKLDPLFAGRNVNYLIGDMSAQIERLNDEVGRLTLDGADRRTMKDLAETSRLLTHEFDAIKGILHQVHDSRTAMNDFSEALHGLNRVSEGIQKRIMETRMVSVGPLFQRFRRVVRDISKATHKEVELVLHGEATELDKRMIDELGDPLTHMIRNAVDHGIESPEERVAAGKPRVAQVQLNAYHRGRHICIEVRDDGKGVNVEAIKKKIVEREMSTAAQVDQMSDKELTQYIFKPGFSTAAQVTDLSGRGMGMDIVINKLENINGTIEVDSEAGCGTVVTIKLPLTLAIITSLIARIGNGVYAVPLETVAEIINVPQDRIQSIQRTRVIRVRDRVIPLAFFEHVFGSDLPDLQTASRNDPLLTVVILGVQDDTMGLVVDELIGQEEIVIKNLATNFRNVNGIAGASIMGDGSVSLILDVAAMLSMFTTRAGRVNALDVSVAPSNSDESGRSQPPAGGDDTEKQREPMAIGATG